MNEEHGGFVPNQYGTAPLRAKVVGSPVSRMLSSSAGTFHVHSRDFKHILIFMISNGSGHMEASSLRQGELRDAGLSKDYAMLNSTCNL